MLKPLVVQLYKDVEAAAKKAKEYEQPDADVVDLYNSYLKETKAAQKQNKHLQKLPTADHDIGYPKLSVLLGQLKAHLDGEVDTQ